MDMGIKVFLAILFVLILVFLLFLYNQLSNNIDRRHVIARNPRLVFAPCTAPADLQLDPVILASLPELNYVAGTMPLECSVCISEYKAGEKIRLLPNCNHYFHIDCVDMWFHSHNTCPLCRAHIENLIRNLMSFKKICDPTEFDLECGLSESTLATNGTQDAVWSGRYPLNFVLRN